MFHEASAIINNSSALKITKEFCQNKKSFIVDIGSGNGFFLRQIQQEGYQNVIGIDSQDYGIGNKIVDICYERFPFENSSVDFISAWEVVEHLENPHFAFKEIHRVLKTGGLFIFSMPNAFHWSNKINFLWTGNFLRWNVKNDHKTILTHDLLTKMISNRFDLVSVRYSYPEFWSAKVLGFFWGRLNTFLKNYFARFLPENQFFGHFVIYILKKHQ